MGQIANKLLALNSVKHTIREAINAKGGGPLSPSDPMDLFAPAIEGIPTGGEVPSLEELLIDYHRVMFIDWDGTILKDVMVKDGDPVEAPESPTKWEKAGRGLEFARWTTSPGSSVKQDMSIGATYTLKGSAGAVLRVRKNVADGNNITPPLSITLYGTYAYINWGDGTGQYVTTTSNIAPHSYTGDERDNPEHVVVIYFGDPTKGTVKEDTSYAYEGYTYGVFTKDAWVSSYVDAFGWPANTGSNPPSLTYPSSSTKDRYCAIRAYVIPGGNGSNAIALHVPVSGRLLIAKDSGGNSVTLRNDYLEAQTGYTIIRYSGLIIPIQMSTFSIGKNLFGMVGRTQYRLETYAYYSSSSYVIISWPRLVIRCSSIAYADDSHVVAVKGNMQNIYSYTQLAFYIGTIGLERLLHTLPAVTSSRTITIKWPGTGREKLSAALEAELTEKGYTIAYSAYI